VFFPPGIATRGLGGRLEVISSGGTRINNESLAVPGGLGLGRLKESDRGTVARVGWRRIGEHGVVWRTLTVFSAGSRRHWRACRRTEMFRLVGASSKASRGARSSRLG